ncbi:hypothetical protein [Runella slithyformis]|uniref:Preprotein translocase subunit SecB n=1 Tax=Runella slithyformis (strain ATCC 29530 / DSM 19594 / LMG 11500 / NCIMB 11436 / LSU 4) TaxID=761193 RepID=A0A7U3ZMC9_RUNSL|nr:hypothetical protein [Runella slithyformis]AEI49870.1 hypothetical protein Runsl_3508 [Runella slithyformis DSM 19594]
MSDKQPFDPEKLSMIEFKLIKGQIDTPEEFDVEKIEGHQVENSLKLGFNLEDKLIKADFTADVKTDSKGGNEEEARGIFHLVFIYRVDNLEMLATPDNNTLDVHPALINALSGITYSTARGIMLTRLQGTAFKDFILPIINPNKLL